MAARRKPATSAHGGEPASPWPDRLTRLALGILLALAVARAMMSESVRDAFDPSPNSTAAPRGPGPAATLLLNALCCLPALLVLLRRAIDREYIVRWSWSQVLLGVLALWACISVAWSTDKFVTLITASSFLAAAVIVWTAAQLVRSWSRLRLVGGVALGLLMIYAAQGLVYRFVDVPENAKFWAENKEQILRERGWEPGSFAAMQFERKFVGGEMIGFNHSPNSFAAMIVMLIVICAGAAIQRRASGDDWAWSIAILLPIPPALLVLYFTGTRTAAGTLFIAAIALMTLAPARIHGWLATHWKLAYSGAIAAILLGAAAVIGHGVTHGSLPQDSMNFRWRYWVAASRLTAQHALTGVGWGNFGPHYLSTRLPAAAEEVKDPHNFIVRAFVELGIIGGVLALAWLARAAWELVRPITPPAPASPPQSRASPIATIALIAAGGVVLNQLVATDWSQTGVYVTLEMFRRAMALGLLIVAMVLVCVRTTTAPELDDRAAPWLLRAMLIALGVFFVHNLVDFVLAEPGPLMFFAVVLGSVLGVRSPSAAGKRRRRGIAQIALVAGVAAWMAAMLMIVIPVADAEQRAHEADEQVRAGRPDLAAGIYRAAVEKTPYNADYAYRNARALIMAGASAEQVKAALDLAIARDPCNVMYLLTRANYELHLPKPEIADVRRDFVRALALDPHNVQARLDFAAAMEKLNDPAEAARQYRLALETNRQYDAREPKRLSAERVKEIEERIRAIGQ